MLQRCCPDGAHEPCQVYSGRNVDVNALNDALGGSLVVQCTRMRLIVAANVLVRLGQATSVFHMRSREHVVRLSR